MSMMRSARVLAAACLGFAVLGGSAPVRAEEKRSAVDPRAERVLKTALANVLAAKSFSFTAEVAKDAPLDSGQKVQYLGTFTAAVRRPDKLLLAYRGEDRENAMYYDGKTFVLSNPADHAYATWSAPATIDALLAAMKEKIGFRPPLAVLFTSEAGIADAGKKLRSGVYLGRVAIRGVDCHHVAFSGETVDFQLWVAVGEPVIKRIVITFRDLPTAPQNTINFTDWNFNANLSDHLFAYEPSPGENRIEFSTGRKP